MNFFRFLIFSLICAVIFGCGNYKYTKDQCSAKLNEISVSNKNDEDKIKDYERFIYECKNFSRVGDDLNPEILSATKKIKDIQDNIAYSAINKTTDKAELVKYISSHQGTDVAKAAYKRMQDIGYNPPEKNSVIEKLKSITAPKGMKHKDFATALENALSGDAKYSLINQMHTQPIWSFSSGNDTLGFYLYSIAYFWLDDLVYNLPENKKTKPIAVAGFEGADLAFSALISFKVH